MKRILLTSLALALFTSGAQADFQVITNGKALCEIVVADDALPQVKFAAKELQSHLKTMTGVAVPIVANPGGKTPVIYVGKSPAADAAGAKVLSSSPEGYRIIANDRYLALVGNDSRTLPIPRNAHDAKAKANQFKDWQKYTGKNWDFPRHGLYDTRYFNAEAGFSFYDPSGTLFAVYDLLEQLGVRWYMPHPDIGTVIPERKSVAIADQDHEKAPAFSYRFMRWSFPSGDLPGFLWAKRQRLGLSELIWMGHGTSIITKTSGESNPEYFATVGGRLRNNNLADPVTGIQAKKGQEKALPRLSPVLSDALVGYSDFFFKAYPESRILPVGPSDAFTSIDDRDVAAGWLKEERGENGRLSDYVWSFVNTTADALGKKHPDKRAMGLAYSYYRQAPENIDRLSPYLALTFCQTRARFGTGGADNINQISAEREAWLNKLTSQEFYLWEYNLYHLGPGLSQTGQLRGLPVFFPTTTQRDLQALKGKSRGEFVECSFDGKGKMLFPALNHLQYAFQARLYWEPEIDFEKWFQDYLTQFYGPAAEEMGTFWRFAEEVWMRPDSRLITAVSGFLKPADIERFFALLKSAREKAGESVYGTRIALIEEECQPMKGLFESLTRTGPDFRTPTVAEKLVIDGRLDEAAWRTGADSTTYLTREFQTGDAMTTETRVQLRWAKDGSGLYVGVVAMEPNMAALSKETVPRDSFSIYDSDFVEIMLETPERSAFRIVVGPNGEVHDHCTDTGVEPSGTAWNFNGQSAVHQESDRWSVEAFIPMASLDTTVLPTPDAPWGINVCRTRMTTGKAENSAISPTYGRFFNTSKFGNIKIETLP